jgi:hypothetical protein
MVEVLPILQLLLYLLPGRRMKGDSSPAVVEPGWGQGHEEQSSCLLCTGRRLDRAPMEDLDTCRWCHL